MPTCRHAKPPHTRTITGQTANWAPQAAPTGAKQARALLTASGCSWPSSVPGPIRTDEVPDKQAVHTCRRGALTNLLLGAGDALDHLAGPGAVRALAAVRTAAAAALRADVLAGALSTRGRLIAGSHFPRRRRNAGPRARRANRVLVQIVSIHVGCLPRRTRLTLPSGPSGPASSP
jgi:hypothetical protein